MMSKKLNVYSFNDEYYVYLGDYKQLQNNWNELKAFVEKDVKRWEQEEQKWIEQGFMKFGGEANNKIIFKKVLSKIQDLESRK